MGKAKVVSLINYKGGVGKTTTTYHIGCSLAQHHRKRVLLIDIDPQTNLTFLCSPYSEWEKFKKKNGTIKNLYERFQARTSMNVARAIWKEPISISAGRIQNLDLIPCDIDLLGEDLAGGAVAGTYPTFQQLKKSAEEYVRERSFLKHLIRDVEEKYDYVLIDCAPNLYLMTQNALLASHWYVIPAIPDHLSTIGLSILQRKVSNIEAQIVKATQFVDSVSKSGAAKLGGIIFVKVRIGGMVLTNTHESIMTQVGSTHPGLCFETFTTELIGYGEAAEAAVPVWEHSSKNAKMASRKAQYTSITDEFIRRFV
ncbi:MAG: ParA family protein [Ignavibacteriae bacterium]|nr:ParA family protein [Ignavibacteriota bacterium]